MEAEKPKKAHKKKTSGVKAKKKKEKSTGKVDRHDPRAHTFSGGAQSVAKRVRYGLEKAAKKDRAPKIDKNPDVPPPFIVVVQGPPGCGKTTLITSLVKHYARQKLVQMGGPITLVSSRMRRITLVECPQEMSAMLDLAKVADLVLFLIDASFGFELETFEFINILQVHGFPRIIGVLTHLDVFKDNKQLRKTKKALKHRFWSEVYEGAKLFHFSGLQYGRYHRNEIQNLARFIAIAKTPLLSWRQAHPYMLALRWEDQTDPSLPREAPRRLDLYGYVCGGRLREGTQAHLPGVGDFAITAIKSLPDPCPHPQEVEAERNKAQNKKTKKQDVLRSLAERHRVIYAPGSEVGSITVDSDAMYIHLPEVQVGFTGREGQDEDGEVPEAVKLVRAMQEREGALDSAVKARPGLRLLSGSTARLPEKAGEDEAGGASGAGQARQRRRAPDLDDAVPARRALEGEDGEEGDDADDEEGEDDDDDEEGEEDAQGAEGSDAEEHRRDVLETARRRFARGLRLEEVIYGAGLGAGKGSEPDAGAVSSGHQPTDHKAIPLFDGDEEAAEAPGQKSQQGGPLSGLLGNMGDLDGIDTARMPCLPGETDERDEEAREALKERKFITGGWSSAEEDEDGEPKPAEGDNPAAEGTGEATAGANKGSVTNVSTADLVGFSDGMPIAAFVRVRLDDVPAACVAEMKRERPLILGGLLPGESRMGLVQVRVKRHRWHPKLLKSGDALLLSAGWRRFQTVPTFSLEDRGEKRMRFLKYTLEHMHCTMTSYGPMMPPNTGVMAFRSWEKVGHFRVCATGGVLESAPNFQIMKKLKLCGEPYKIFRNTAFIKGMFNSDLEVSKYKNTKIQTVSGIRGEVKKAEGDKGNFRATFEDRILLSDLVVCKCWIDVKPKEFFHPVIDVAQWRPARLIGELRAAKGVPVPDKRDSAYGKQFVRAERKFNPLKINKKLEDALPFKAKSRVKRRLATGPKGPLHQKAAIVSTEKELAVNALLERLQTVKRMREKLKKETSSKKKAIKEAKEKFIQDKRDARTREAKKEKYKEKGQKEEKKRKHLRLE